MPLNKNIEIIITGPPECVECHDRANHIAPGGTWYCDIHYLPILQKIVNNQSWHDRAGAVEPDIQYHKNKDGTQTAVMRGLDSIFSALTDSEKDYWEQALDSVIYEALNNRHKRPKWTTLMEEVAELTLLFEESTIIHQELSYDRLLQ